MYEVDGENVGEDPLEDLYRKRFLDEGTDFDDCLHGYGCYERVETGDKIVWVRPIRGVCDRDPGCGVGMPAVLPLGVLDAAVPVRCAIEGEAADCEDYEEEEKRVVCPPASM